VIAYVFPGQGAQYVGMGRQLAEGYPEAHETFQTASRVLGTDLGRLCWQGPDELLKQTEHTQPAILTASIAAYNVARSRIPAPAMAAGLSLGEYSALVAAGVVEFADAVRIVQKRGLFMAEAARGVKTAMAALMGLDGATVERVCTEARGHGVVEPVNFNSPGQIVIAGEAAAVDYAIGLAKAAGAKRAVKLDVSAPFHTSLMRPVADRFAGVLGQVTFQDARIPVVSNVTARPVEQGNEIRNQLIAQIASPVRWEQSVRTMAERGVTTFVEIGPGTTLSGLIRKTIPGVQTLHVEDQASLDDAMRSLDQVSAH
jgi:[acyl-carrier-protein] S-malonyltransferase